jgi:hypothetical protein
MIMHNMIIKSEREAQVKDDQPFYFQGPLAQVNDVCAEFSAFLTVQLEICKKDKHNHLQGDLVELLWIIYFLFELFVCLNCCMNNYSFILLVCMKL